jgi:hypothetical protein
MTKERAWTRHGDAEEVVLMSIKHASADRRNGAEAVGAWDRCFRFCQRRKKPALEKRGLSGAGVGPKKRVT